MRILILLFCITSIFVFGQNVTGRVVNDNDQVLPGVSVYVDGSQVSTTSAADGSFELSVPNLKQGNIIFSKSGYGDIAYSLKDAFGKKLKVVMEKENNIEEVKLVGYSNKDFNKYINVFRDSFLGASRDGVKITNENELTFAYDNANRILRVKAKKPLIIVNEYLGYQVEYKLMSFSVDYAQHYSGYTGTSLYKPLKASSAQLLKYKMNRINAYYGSVQHFFRAVYQDKVEAEGFITDHVKEFESAGKKGIAVIEQNIPSSKYRSIVDGQVTFSFPDILGVRYKKFLYDIRDKQLVKTQTVITLKSLVYTNGNLFTVTSDGNYSDPNEMLFQESWATDKIAKTLPLDYNPNE